MDQKTSKSRHMIVKLQTFGIFRAYMFLKRKTCAYKISKITMALNVKQ